MTAVAKQLPELKCIALNRAELTGDLNHDTVQPIVDQGKQLIEKFLASESTHTGWIVDCQQVGQVSSAAAAMFLHWLRWLQDEDAALQLVNLPAALKPILEISDLQPLLDAVVSS